MQGFKIVDEGIVNQYGFPYEFSKKYFLNGELKYGKNGFHFCSTPENTLRFSKERRPKEFIIVNITASGEIECGDDYLENREYDFDGMYASTEIIINRIIPRQEIFEIILNSNNENRIQRYIQLAELTEEEINAIREKYKDFYTNAYIDYYQFKDKEAFSLELKK